MPWSRLSPTGKPQPSTSDGNIVNRQLRESVAARRRWDCRPRRRARRDFGSSPAESSLRRGRSFPHRQKPAVAARHPAATAVARPAPGSSGSCVRSACRRRVRNRARASSRSRRSSGRCRLCRRFDQPRSHGRAARRAPVAPDMHWASTMGLAGLAYRTS